MANLKNVKINSNTVIDVDGNLHLIGQSSLKDKDGSSIINYNGYWVKPSIVHPGNSLDIDISSPQNSSLDIKNSAEGSASLKINGVEIINTNSIVNASTIEDKFLRNDQDDNTTGTLTAQKFITIPLSTEYQNSMILFHESEFRIESDLNEQAFLNIVNSQAGAGLKVNNTEIINPETSKVIADAIEDKFLRNDSSDITIGELTAEGGLVSGSSYNKIWVIKKICDGIISSYAGATIGSKGEYLQLTSTTPVLYIPINEHPGSIITRIRCRYYTAASGVDTLAYSVRKQREDITGSSVGYEGSQEWKQLTSNNIEVVDTYDIQDFTIQANYKYWFEIKAQSVSNSIKIYSIAYEMSVRKY